MNKRIVALCCSALLCATGYAIAQTNTNMGRSISKYMSPLTPAQKAKFFKQYNLGQAAAKAMDAHEYAEAEQDARQSMALGFGSGNARDILAAALMAQGRAEQALQQYQELWNNNDSDPRSMLPYALLLLQKGQWAQALAVYNRAMPRVGTSLIYGNRILAADSNFLSDKPEPKMLETDIHIALGNAYSNEGTWSGHTANDAALREYTAAILLEPDSPLANLAYAQGLWQVGRKKEAVAAFQHVADTYTGDVKASAEDALRDHRLGPDDQ